VVVWRSARDDAPDWRGHRWCNRSDVARGIADEVVGVSESVFEVACGERCSTAKHINKAALRPQAAAITLSTRWQVASDV
jgi:hypothetical protein